MYIYKLFLIQLFVDKIMNMDANKGFKSFQRKIDPIIEFCRILDTKLIDLIFFII